MESKETATEGTNLNSGMDAESVYEKTAKRLSYIIMKEIDGYSRETIKLTFKDVNEKIKHYLDPDKAELLVE